MGYPTIRANRHRGRARAASSGALTLRGKGFAMWDSTAFVGVYEASRIHDDGATQNR